jgi:hypothetical protein
MREKKKKWMWRREKKNKWGEVDKNERKEMRGWRETILVFFYL